MQCPSCGEYDNKVMRSNLKIRNNIRRRIRICLKCGAQLPTDEKINLKEYRRRNPRRPVRVS